MRRAASRRRAQRRVDDLLHAAQLLRHERVSYQDREDAAGIERVDGYLRGIYAEIRERCEASGLPIPGSVPDGRAAGKPL